MCVFSTEDLKKFLSDTEGPVLVDNFVSELDVVRPEVTHWNLQCGREQCTVGSSSLPGSKLVV